MPIQKAKPERESLDPRTAPPDRRAVNAPSDHELSYLKEMHREKCKREREALRLYEPLPFQEEFHACTAKEAILLKGNQVGGSLAGFVEVARAFTGQDPHNKYPLKDVVIVCIGYGEGHIGRVIWPYLFESGRFRIIKDATTRKWRTFRPWPADETFDGRAGDAGREKDSRPAPPLIPKRFIAGKPAWVKRSQRIFSRVTSTTGATIFALNSAGDPNHAQGFQAHLIHLDEDLATAGWYGEMLARTTHTRGFMRWTAMAHNDTDDIVNLIHRAEEDESVPKRSVCITATVFDNPFIPKESRDENIRIWKSEGEHVYEKRALGKLSMGHRLMYPQFSKYLHDFMREQSEETEAQGILRERMGEPPDDWTRYMIVDPGSQVCAVTFWCAPPPEMGDQRFLYDELYIHQCTAKKFAAAVLPKVQSVAFHDFIADMHGGKLREIGSGMLPIQQYQDELEALGVKCEKRGSRFKAAQDDIAARENDLREWLTIRRDGTTTFMYNAPRCPNIAREFDRFHRKIVHTKRGELTSEKGDRRMTHCIECAEYAAADGLPYSKPKFRVTKMSWLESVLAGEKRRDDLRRAMSGGETDDHITLGPVGASA